MRKIVHVFMDSWELIPSIEALIKHKIVSAASDKQHTVIARYGVNKSTLKKLLKLHKDE